MIIGFEDAFTNVQADYISLCMEFAQNNVDIVYGYMYQTPTEQTCNAFFRKNGEIKTLNDLGPSDRIFSFFDAGYEDIDKLMEVCKRYEHKCPFEIRMIYDARTGQFDAHYAYSDPTADKDFGAGKLFMDWMEEERNKQLDEK